MAIVRMDFGWMFCSFITSFRKICVALKRVQIHKSKEGQPSLLPLQYSFASCCHRRAEKHVLRLRSSQGRSSCWSTTRAVWRKSWNRHRRHETTDHHQALVAKRSKALTFLLWNGVVWVWIPLETYIFILNFSLPPRSEQVNGAVAN